MGSHIEFSLASLLAMINDWATGWMVAMGYPGLAAVMFLENVFPPIPSEVILPFAGSLTLSGHFSLPGIVLVATAGSLAGAWIFYAAGSCVGEDGVRTLLRRHGRWLMLSEKDLDRALAWFRVHGEKVIFFGRMVPMVRSLISVPAGFSRMNPLRFSIFTVLGTALWNLGLALSGRLLGKNWVQVEAFLARFEGLVLAGLSVLLAVFVLKRWRKFGRQGAVPEMEES